MSPTLFGLYIDQLEHHVQSHDEDDPKLLDTLHAAASKELGQYYYSTLGTLETICFSSPVAPRSPAKQTLLALSTWPAPASSNRQAMTTA